MPLPLVSMNGNVVDDPELRFTPGGHAVARFRVASSERVLDRQTQQWRDGDSCFLTVEVWRQQAENIAETVKKGMNVRVEGRLRQRSYDTKEGEKRTVYEVKGEDISVSLLRQTAAVTKNVGGGQSNGGAPAGGGQPTDAWSTPATAPAGAGFGGGSEPPF